MKHRVEFFKSTHAIVHDREPYCTSTQLIIADDYLLSSAVLDT